jgi:hypothetical protein
MAAVRFLAPAVDHRSGQEGIVYGPGHETAFQAEDVAFVMECWLAGKLEITDSTGLPLAQFEVSPPAA